MVDPQPLFWFDFYLNFYWPHVAQNLLGKWVLSLSRGTWFIADKASEREHPHQKQGSSGPDAFLTISFPWNYFECKFSLPEPIQKEWFWRYVDFFKGSLIEVFGKWWRRYWYSYFKCGARERKCVLGYVSCPFSARACLSAPWVLAHHVPLLFQCASRWDFLRF